MVPPKPSLAALGPPPGSLLAKKTSSSEATGDAPVMKTSSVSLSSESKLDASAGVTSSQGDLPTAVVSAEDEPGGTSRPRAETDAERKKKRKEEKKRKKQKRKQAWAATVDEEEFGWNYDGAGVVTPDMFVLRPIKAQARPAESARAASQRRLSSAGELCTESSSEDESSVAATPPGVDLRHRSTKLAEPEKTPSGSNDQLKDLLAQSQKRIADLEAALARAEMQGPPDRSPPSASSVARDSSSQPEEKGTQLPQHVKEYLRRAPKPPASTPTQAMRTPKSGTEQKHAKLSGRESQQHPASAPHSSPALSRWYNSKPGGTFDSRDSFSSNAPQAPASPSSGVSAFIQHLDRSKAKSIRAHRKVQKLHRKQAQQRMLEVRMIQERKDAHIRGVSPAPAPPPPGQALAGLIPSPRGLSVPPQPQQKPLYPKLPSHPHHSTFLSPDAESALIRLKGRHVPSVESLLHARERTAPQSFPPPPPPPHITSPGLQSAQAQTGSASRLFPPSGSLASEHAFSSTPGGSPRQRASLRSMHPSISSSYAHPTGKSLSPVQARREIYSSAAAAAAAWDPSTPRRSSVKKSQGKDTHFRQWAASESAKAAAITAAAAALISGNNRAIRTPPQPRLGDSFQHSRSPPTRSDIQLHAGAPRTPTVGTRREPVNLQRSSDLRRLNQALVKEEHEVHQARSQMLDHVLERQRGLALRHG